MPTTTIQDEHPATPEEIWAILREITRKQEAYAEEERLRRAAYAEEERLRREAYAEEERLRREKDKIRREAEAKEEKLRREAYAEEERLRREAEAKEEKLRREAEAREAREAKKRMAAIEKNIGGLSNRFGEVIEHLVAPGIMDKFNEMGFKLSRLSENNRIRDAHTKKTIAEVDIMLENPDIVIAVSVKSKAGDYDINEHTEQMEKLRQYADSRGDNRLYFGAIASAVTSDSLRARILKAGFYAVEQAGDTMRINVPADFIPRQW